MMMMLRCSSPLKDWHVGCAQRLSGRQVTVMMIDGWMMTLTMAMMMLVVGWWWCWRFQRWRWRHEAVFNNNIISWGYTLNMELMKNENHQIETEEWLMSPQSSIGSSCSEKDRALQESSTWKRWAFITIKVTITDTITITNTNTINAIIREGLKKQHTSHNHI